MIKVALKYLLAQAIEPKNFPLEGKLESMSDEALKEHRDKLYHGYVENYNKIIDLIDEADKESNVHFSEHGELKRRFSWAHNGVLLHELYFQNLGGERDTPDQETTTLIESEFGSIDNFKEELLATAKIPPVGWAIWGYSMLDEKTHIVPIDEHHNHTPLGFIPLLVVDSFEHAYYKDYMTDRNSYLEATWKDLNWEIIENRVLLLNGILEFVT